MTWDLFQISDQVLTALQYRFGSKKMLMRKAEKNNRDSSPVTATPHFFSPSILACREPKQLVHTVFHKTKYLQNFSKNFHFVL